MKQFLLLLSTIFIGLVFFAQESARLANSNFYLQEYIKKGDFDQPLGLFVKGSKSDADDFVKTSGGIYRGGIKGGWHYLRIPGDKVIDLIQDNRFSINYRPYKGYSMNDTMLVNNKINDIHNGVSPLDTSYSGKDVIVGFIDTGIDWRHGDFKTSLGDTRILHIWDHTLSTGGTTPSAYGYGQEWDSIAINANSPNHSDATSHGTLVTGIASGNGLDNGKNKGVAPESYIIMVETDFNALDWLATVVDGIEYIFDKADAYNMPCVINLSAGEPLGSHDGLDPYTLYVDSLLDAKRGRIMVAAAGNWRKYGPYHVHTETTPDSTFTWFKVNPASGFGGPAAFWEVWADTASFNQVEFAIGADRNWRNMSGDNYEFRGRTAFQDITTNLGVVSYDTIRNTNNDILATVQYYKELRDGQYLLEVFIPAPDSSDYLFRFEAFGNGSFDIWGGEEFGVSEVVNTIPTPAIFKPIEKYVLPDTLQSIASSFQCSPNVVTVANYVNESGFVNKYGDWIDLGEMRGALAIKSSIGPTRDGRIKPDISASGEVTVSAAPVVYLDFLNANPPQDTLLALGERHVANGGTSMACPVVAGIGALLLEKCPSISAQEFMQTIRNNAFTDNFTGTVPNIAFGYGKVDGFASLTSTNFSPSYTGNTLFCLGDSTEISIDPNYSTFNWSNGDTTNNQIFTTADTISFFAQNSQGCKSETVSLTMTVPMPTINCVGGPFSFCERDSLLYTTSGDYNSVLWSDNSTATTRYFSSAGAFDVVGIDTNGCEGLPCTVQVTEDPAHTQPIIGLQADSMYVQPIAGVQYHWFVDGVLIAITTDNFIHVNQDGDYTVVIYGANQCPSLESTPYLIDFTGITENNILGDIRVFPNPSLGNLMISSNSIIIKQIELYELNGKLLDVINVTANSQHLDLNKLSNGSYYIKVFSESGIFVKKVLLNR